MGTAMREGEGSAPTVWLAQEKKEKGRYARAGETWVFTGIPG